MIIGLNGLGLAIISSSLHALWLVPVLLVALVSSFLAERLLPCHEAWNGDHDDRATDLWHFAIYEASAVNAIAMMPLVAWLVPWQGIWPHDWPLVLQVLLAIVFVDVVFTLIHYLSHHHPWLWKLHAVHHSVPRMYGFNGFVRHPLHQAIDTAIGTLPLALAGMSMQVAVLLGLAVSIQLLVQHSNVDYRIGWLQRHLAIGRLHHLHHVNWGREGDVNFGLFFTLWDRLLGTLQLEPARPIQSTDLGIDTEPDFPRSYWQHLLYPFLPKRPGSPGLVEIPDDQSLKPIVSSGQAKAA
jgi:sterol desaturase/sphingolipid hydroxylase (fatty acid hydroxylase superfamily)